MSVEDSDFSHSQDMSARRYLPHQERAMQQKLQSRLQHADEDDDEEDVEAPVVTGTLCVDNHIVVFLSLC